MRRLLLAAAGAMTLAGMATTANAATTVTGTIPSPAVLTPPASASFGSVITSGPGTFSDSFTFTIAGTDGNQYPTDAQLSTLLLNGSQNINFTSITLDGMSVFTKTSTDPNPETWAILSPILLASGNHMINVAGNLIGPNGSYSGTINVQAAVPEAKTWAMMLLGFGAMGMAIRRRRRPVLAQLA
jgi:hypothetical protein